MISVLPGIHGHANTAWVHEDAHPNLMVSMWMVLLGGVIQGFRIVQRGTVQVGYTHPWPCPGLPHSSRYGTAEGNTVQSG